MKVKVWQCKECQDIIINQSLLKLCENCKMLGTFEQIGIMDTKGFDKE